MMVLFHRVVSVCMSVLCQGLCWWIGDRSFVDQCIPASTDACVLLVFFCRIHLSWDLIHTVQSWALLPQRLVPVRVKCKLVQCPATKVSSFCVLRIRTAHTSLLFEWCWNSTFYFYTVQTSPILILDCFNFICCLFISVKPFHPTESSARLNALFFFCLCFVCCFHDFINITLSMNAS